MKANLRSLALAASVVVAAAAAGTVAWAAPLARSEGQLFVVNQGSGTVTPVRLPGEVAGPAIRVGRHPDAIVATPDGRTVYVANGGSGTVTPITVATDKAGRPIRVGKDPVALAVSRDGKTLYVADTPGLVAGPSAPGSVVPVRISTGKAGRPIRAGWSPAIALTPDGRTALVLDQETAGGHSSVISVNLRTKRPADQIALPSTPYAVAVAPGGRTAYVPGAGRMVMVAHRQTWQGVLTPIRLRGLVRGTPIVVGRDPDMGNEAPEQVLFSPRGDIAYVVYPGLGAVVPVNTVRGRAGRPIPVGEYADAAVLTSSGRLLYVQTNRGVTEVNTVTHTRTSVRTGSEQAGSIAVSPDGRTVFALGSTANGNGVLTPITVGTNRKGHAITVGAMPVTMVVVP